MDKRTPIYVSRVLNVPLEEVEKVMKDMDLLQQMSKQKAQTTANTFCSA